MIDAPNKRRIAIRAARILNEACDGYLDETIVIVADDTIETIAHAAPTELPLLDLGERTLLPGLIDTHTHILLHSNRLQNITPQDNLTYMILQENPGHRVARAVRNVKISLENGFTSLRDLGTEGAGYDDVGIRDAIDEGVVPGPRLQVSGRALTPTGTYLIRGYRPDWEFPTGVGMCDGPDECRLEVRRQAANGVDWIKVYATAGYGDEVSDDGYPQSPPNWTFEELSAIVDEARRRGLRVAAHATTLDSTQMAIDVGVDTIEHAHAIRPEMAEQIVEKGIFVVPTITISVNAAAGIAGETTPIWQSIPAAQRASLENCRAAGAKIAFGTDVGSGPIPWTQLNQAVEFIHQASFGLTPPEALRTATTDAAELLGQRGRLGVVAPEAIADLVAVEGDPLSDLTTLQAIDFVMKDGAVVRQPQAEHTLQLTT